MSTKNQPNTDTLVQLIVAWRKEPTLFAKQVFGITLKDHQVEFLNAIRDNELVTWRAGTGVGKSAALAIAHWWFLLCWSHIKIAVLSSTSGNLKVTLWKEIMKWHSEIVIPEIRDFFDITSEQIRRKDSPERAFSICRAADECSVETTQGLHENAVVVIIDEASKFDSTAIESFHGIFADPFHRLILTGNPTKTSGYFYNTHKRWDHWYRLHTCANQFTVRSPKLFETLSKQYGSDSFEYSVRILGEFYEATNEFLFTKSKLESLLDKQVEQLAGPYIWGFDIAREGGDRTCIVCRRRNQVLWVEWWTGDAEKTFERFMARWNRTPLSQKPYKVFVDVAGIGAPVYDRLRNDAKFRNRGIIQQFHPQSPSTKQNLFKDMKAQVWATAKEWSEDINSSIQPTAKELVEDLAEIGYDYDTGVFRVESKLSMKKRGKRSPDIADAFVMTFMDNTTSNIKPNQSVFEQYEQTFQQLERAVV